MIKVKPLAITGLVLTTLVLGLANYFVTNPQSSQKAFFESYNLDMGNKTVTLSVSASQDAILFLYIIHNNTLTAFKTPGDSSTPSVSFSFPGQQVKMSAWLTKTLESNNREYFLKNKSFYQPLPLEINSYTSLTNENATQVFFKTNVALQEELSSVSLVNSSSNSWFYTLSHYITVNTTLNIVDSYYRHFTKLVTALKPQNNITNSGPNNPPPIIVISNQTIDHLIINTTVSSKTFIANKTTIEQTSVFKSQFYSNKTEVKQASIFSCFLNSNSSLLMDHSFFNQSEIKADTIIITDSILNNSTILAHTLFISNSVVNKSIIHADSTNYQNVTFIHKSPDQQPAPKDPNLTGFNYTVSYQIINYTSVQFQLFINLSSNISISVQNQAIFMTKNLTNVTSQSTIPFDGLLFGLYNVTVQFMNSLGLFNDSFQIRILKPFCNCSASYLIQNQTTILLTLTTNMTTNRYIQLISSVFNSSKFLKDLNGTQLVTFYNLPFAIYSLTISFITEYGSYNQSFIITLRDTLLPILRNYSLITGYTNVSASFTFSEIISGTISLFTNTSMIYSTSLTNKSNVVLSYSQLNHSFEYYLRINVYDSNFNVLAMTLTPFHLKAYSFIEFNFSTDKNFISNTSSGLTIYPTLVIDNQSITQGNYTLEIYFTLLNKSNYFYNECICSLKNFFITFDKQFLDNLPNTSLELTISLQSFNISAMKLLYIHSQIKLEFTVDFRLDQSNQTNNLLVSINSTINTTATVFFGLINQPSAVFKLTNLSILHEIFFTDLFYNTYNLTLIITSWDNQSGFYSHYFKVNDTITPRILSYTILSNFTAFNCSIIFSEPTNLSALIYSENSGLLVSNYTNFSYLNNNFFTVSGLNPYLTYKIELVGFDSAGNRVSYTITNINLQSITSAFISTTIDSSVISLQNDTITCNTSVLINQKSMIDSLVITTNATVTTYSTISGIYQIKFDSIFLNSLSQNTVLNVTITDTTFNITSSILLIYVLQDSGSVSPDISVLTNSSFINSGIPLKLTVAGSFATSKTFGTQTIIEVRLFNTSISSGFFQLTTGGTSFNESIVIFSSFSLLSGYLTLEVIVYGNNIFKSVIKMFTIQINSSTPNNPSLKSQTISLVTTSTILTIASTEPVAVQLSYGTNKSTISSYSYPAQYTTQAIINLSALMVLNSNNYYELTLIDSLGNSVTYNNNSNYYQVFVPKLDLIPPYNTTAITITADYYIQFSASEPVTVTVTCEDYFGTFTTCYSSTSPSIDINGLLILSVPGIYYTITKVVLTDKAQNLFVINPNIQFYYS